MGTDAVMYHTMSSKELTESGAPSEQSVTMFCRFTGYGYPLNLGHPVNCHTISNNGLSFHRVPSESGAPSELPYNDKQSYVIPLRTH